MTATVSALRVGLRTGSDFVGCATPQLGWQVVSESPGWRQAAARVQLVEKQGTRSEVQLSGSESVNVEWPFRPLRPREKVWLSVQVAGQDGAWSEWSAARKVTGGFLGPDEWTARHVTMPAAGPTRPLLLRREFSLDRRPSLAVLYLTACGAGSASINGEATSDAVLAPGWTAYPDRLVHTTVDVTHIVSPGANALGIVLAGGWYTEEFGFGDGARRVYGDRPSVAAQLALRYANGHTEWLVTDSAWRVTDHGPWLSSSIYQGETYDARRTLRGWDKPGFDDRDWADVETLAIDVVPEAQACAPIRPVAEVPVVRLLSGPEAGTAILDFGQNLAGRVRLRVQGSAGTTVTLRHAEELEDGGLATRPLRNAASTDRYILCGSGIETWAPSFTYHGFRYVEVDGWPGELDPGAFVAEVLSTDLRRTGWFTCSSPLLERLHENVVWSMRSNFMSLPTDCPQRDERLGWTGDIQVFAPTAATLFDCDGFLVSWLRDLSVEQQLRDGIVPVVVPDPLHAFPGPVAAWGDAATVVPWVLYERFGDRSVLAPQYPSMRAWVDAVLAVVEPESLVWDSGFQFGDWLDPTAPPDRPADAQTDPGYVATCHLFRSLQLTAGTAQMLGYAEDKARYSALAERVRQTILSTYVTASGRIVSDTPTAYALAIVFGLLPGETVTAAGGRLAELVRAAGYRIATGFVGTPIVLDALTMTGHLAAAARLLLQTRSPSWLFPVTMGATTIWERWDSLLENGRINPGGMTSFNHYALGSVVDWLHRVLAGLAPASPGYRHVRIAPHPIDALTHASSRVDTPYGPAEAGWRRLDNGDIAVHAVIPANTEGVIELPDGTKPFEVAAGSHNWCVRTASTQRPPARSIDWSTSLGYLADDPEAAEVILRAVEATDPQRAQEFGNHTRWTQGATLADALILASPQVTAAVEAAFSELNRKRR